MNANVVLEVIEGMFLLFGMFLISLSLGWEVAGGAGILTMCIICRVKHEQAKTRHAIWLNGGPS